MSRQVPKQESHLSFHTVRSPDTHQALQRFSKLFQSCAGPEGKSHAVTNASGGHLTVTGSSHRLLSAVSISRPELKLITAAVQAHLQRWGDGGTFMTLTICRLILLGSDTAVSPFIVRSLYDTFVDIIITHLQEPECPVTLGANLDDLNVLLSYVHSVISSKSLLNLTKVDCDRLSQCVLKAFLDSIPCDVSDSFSYSDRIYCVSIESRPYSDCCVESGLMLLYPECPAYSECLDLQLKKHVLDKSTAEKFGLRECETGIKVALFICSLSGDMEEIVDAHFEVSKSEEEEVEVRVVAEMLAVCDSLEKLGVGVVLSQRVIHPQIKARLRSSGICFVDRLGANVVPYLQDLTGAQPVATILSGDDLTDNIGWLTSVCHQIRFNKSYLHLQRNNSSVVTFVLCGMWEEKLLELKTCVKAALRGLGTLMKDRKLLMGGGCWQVYASQVLKSKVLAKLDQLSAQMSCTKAAVLEVLTAFRSSLLAWALALKVDTDDLLMDPQSCHAWRVPAGMDKGTGTQPMACGCGRKTANADDLATFVYVSVEEIASSSNITQTDGVLPNSVQTRPVHPHTVVDSFSSTTAALKQAVITANLILSIGQFITDKN